MHEEGEEHSIEATPTWAVATVCLILILLSFLMEYLLYLLGQYFITKKRKSLIQALDKMKSVLTLLGFMSLLLTVSERPISRTCIPRSVGETFLPCPTANLDETQEEYRCAEQGKISLLSRSGVRELQFLIFLLAFFHSLSCLLIFSLGMAKMKRWESWEAETTTIEYKVSIDPNRFQLAHQTSFGKRHLSYWSQQPILRWPTCFLRQFYGSVSKADYLTLRHGFIIAHFEEGTNFDFQKYIKRASEKDFVDVVGISFWIWTFSVLFILFNAHGFYSYLWLPFIPLVMLVVVGTKLQDIITIMCLDSHDKSIVVKGALLVRPSDHFFWLGKPKLLLHLMHFILFENSFQLAFFTWTSYLFGFRSCFHRRIEDIVIRVAIALLVYFLCGYVTLPLYALVTQMGTSMRKAVFPEHVVMGLKNWQCRARKNVKNCYSTVHSLDASLDTSVFPDNSHSFRLPTRGSEPPLDTQHVAISTIMDKATEKYSHQEYHEANTFAGFEERNVIPTLEIGGSFRV